MYVIFIKEKKIKKKKKKKKKRWMSISYDQPNWFDLLIRSAI